MTFTISSVVLAGTWAGDRYAWAPWQIGARAVAAALGLAAFVASQRRVAEPVLPLRVFDARNFRLSSMMIFAAGAAMLGDIRRCTSRVSRARRPPAPACCCCR
ncbi:hypothetical protein [Streptomyces sp. NPDC008139]|uniref:hypothetical protein n=1 Tax=Streptomyces sp. NPDC008139 TaxID=3364814 RepID=UPI0036E0EB89